ncbi:cytochrome P450 [Mycena floridula]|nr:cytochrome P450 [Mycena floridula]
MFDIHIHCGPFFLSRSAIMVLSTPNLLAILVSIVCTLLGVLYRRNSASSVRNQLPPGPRKIPFFGNLFQFSALRPYPKWREWAQEYGAVYHLRLGPQDVIVLNTAEAADELFVNRGKIFSSRAPPHVAHDIMSAGQRQVFLPYNKEWKASRKSAQAALSPTASKQLRPLQELESIVLLHDLLAYDINDPNVPGSKDYSEDHWFSLVRRYTTSIVMKLTYGKRIEKIRDNPRLHKIYAVLANLIRVGQPGNYLADAFPILRKLPDFLAPWRVEGRRMHEWEMDLWGGLLKDIQTDMKNGIMTDCYVGNYLKQRNEHIQEAPGRGLTEDGWLRDTLLAYTAGVILEAGSDTTATTIFSFVLYMISHPPVLEKVSEEVRRVVGLDRLPTFEDEENLPYLVACIKETMRKRPASIMGIPHSSDEESIYQGYVIPKGATVIGNIWAIQMDPKRYPNPTAFQPERFYTPGQPTRWKSGPDTAGRDHFVFGWGRRYCQGSIIAENSLFITLARIIWAFDIQAPRDPNTGIPMVPDIADEERTFTEGFVSTPYPFGVEWRPRSAKHAELIRKAYEDTQAVWSAMGLKPDER